jgi:hypothetical protein
MPKYQFQRPGKAKGAIQILVTINLEPAFKQALKEFADRQTLNSGVKVSMGNVIQTTMMQHYREIAVRYRQIKKEQRSEKKYLDGIKRP